MAYASISFVYGETPSASKWNILGTNDASFNDGTGIAVSAITPEKLLTGTGTSWVWQSWTPTWTNLTVGSGTVSAYYAQVGKTVRFRIRFVYGAGSAVGTAPVFTLPVTANTTGVTTGIANNSIGTANANDNSTGGGYSLVVAIASSTTAGFSVINTTFTYPATQGLTSTVPMTWATSDVLWAEGTYEAA